MEQTKKTGRQTVSTDLTNNMAEPDQKDDNKHLECIDPKERKRQRDQDQKRRKREQMSDQEREVEKKKRRDNYQQKKAQGFT